MCSGVGTIVIDGAIAGSGVAVTTMISGVGVGTHAPRIKIKITDKIIRFTSIFLP